MEIFSIPAETCQCFLGKNEELNADIIAKEYVQIYSDSKLKLKTGIFFFSF